MQAALHVTARVQPGKKIEITAPELIEGQDVEVFLILPQVAAPPRQSVLDFIATLPPGPRAAPPRLRTPDALHAATARLSSCALFLTNDRGFRQVPGLPLAVLDDALSP